MRRAVLLSEYRQIDTRPLHLADQCCPIGLQPPAHAGLGAASGKQPSSRTASVSSAGNSQARSAAAERAKYSLTVVRLTPSSRAIARALAPTP
jgi:hypothetical protein